jgi:hypothetical protein
MTNKLTTIAALPQAGGCMSSLPPEVTRWEDLIFPTIDYESAEAEEKRADSYWVAASSAKAIRAWVGIDGQVQDQATLKRLDAIHAATGADVVQMKAPYFQDEAQDIDERANRLLKAVGLGC